MTSWGYSVGGSQLLWRKPPHPGGSRKDKHSSSSEDTSYSGPAPGTPSLGWPNRINIPLPASVLLLPPRRKHFHSWKPPQKNNESKEQGFGKCSGCQENHGFVSSSLGFGLIQWKNGEIPCWLLLPLPRDPLHHSPPNRHTSRAK